MKISFAFFMCSFVPHASVDGEIPYFEKGLWKQNGK